MSGHKVDYDVIIIGGGLAGLTAAIVLSNQNKRVLLIEKKKYPFHKVCGEYVSNEVLGFLQSIGFDPFSFGASRINKLRVSSPSGKNIYANLDLGGFGLSRYIMDQELFHIALNQNVKVLETTKVTDIHFDHNHFIIQTNYNDAFTSSIVIGSYGKRDLLDKKLKRDFIKKHTGYLGVKYHINTDYPLNEIGLDNFERGYCGIVKIEENKFNLCYLYKRNASFSFNSISELEEGVLYKNPVIKNIFLNSEFVFRQPEVINEISFNQKTPVERGIFMCGDAAGLITPLCGNGMAMAIHSGKMISELILTSKILDYDEIPSAKRKQLESEYTSLWRKNFGKRLFVGRTIQSIFGNPLLTENALSLIHSIPKLENWLISNTHGKELVDK